MTLFQNSVLNKYIKLQDQQAVVKAYKKYAKTDEIDKMVYELYGLSEEEIKIVEGE